MNVFTAKEMRECDRRVAEEYGLPSVCLMEAAGIALADACAEELGGDVRGKTITVLCGKGSNGGDGFVAARHLLTRGAKVVVFLLGIEPHELTGDAATQYKSLPLMVLPFLSFSWQTVPNLSKEAALIANPYFAVQHIDLLVDCVYGTKFRPPLPPFVQMFAEAARDRGVPVISCDVPSGVNADTGEVGEGGAFQATRTVTLAGLKRGLLQYPGATYAGRVTVAPVGMPPDILDAAATATLTTMDWVREKLPPRTQSRDANKGRSGMVLVIAGSAGMAGAATLAGMSALRGGAGLVHLAVPESLLDTAAMLAPELVLHGLPETPGRAHGGDGAVDKILALAERADAVALGPGIGTGEETQRFVRAFLERLPADKKLVIDADGLSLLSLLGEQTLAHRAPESTVLTPHPGEAGKLLNADASSVQNDRANAAQSLAKRYRATVLLKGARTLIATDSSHSGGKERLYFNRRGSVALGTAGSGDVLTGLTAALLADRENGLSATDAARIGAFLHAIAGEWCEQKRGAVGVISGDIREALPEARAALYDRAKESFSDV
ncbi:MAG: NAD(P)H-hydrate dehydratase [Armatimonadetes bacterium]|nr:NAD(P)H-hydrate dehydratase [Armatimonadota bacterium]